MQAIAHRANLASAGLSEFGALCERLRGPLGQRSDRTLDQGKVQLERRELLRRRTVQLPRELLAFLVVLVK